MKKMIPVVSAIAMAASLAGCSGKSQSDSTVTADPARASASPAAEQSVQAALTTDIFNPGEGAVFAVSSVLVAGEKDAVLIDAQFSAGQAQRLVERIKASGKALAAIYISHGDPDYYFGLEVLHVAFPDAKILATPQTIAHIEKTKDEKLKVWGPQLAENAPKRIIVPEPLQGDTIELEGQQLKVVGLDGPTPGRTFVWIPSIKTVAGGIPVLWGEHVWMADTQTPESHDNWLATLEKIRRLGPTKVIPGHFVGELPAGIAAVDFTANYIRAFDEAAALAQDSIALIADLKQRYPALHGESSLELSAKVAKGELEWK